jgi:hypothetical protein
MEPNTEIDIWKNYITWRHDLKDKIFNITHISKPDSLQLHGNLIYQIIMTRLHYYRVPKPLPEFNDIEGMAHYWKKYYNTNKGKGTILEFIENYSKYVIED